MSPAVNYERCLFSGVVWWRFVFGLFVHGFDSRLFITCLSSWFLVIGFHGRLSFCNWHFAEDFNESISLTICLLSYYSPGFWSFFFWHLLAKPSDNPKINLGTRISLSPLKMLKTPFVDYSCVTRLTMKYYNSFDLGMIRRTPFILRIQGFTIAVDLSIAEDPTRGLLLKNMIQQLPLNSHGWLVIWRRFVLYYCDYSQNCKQGIIA